MDMERLRKLSDQLSELVEELDDIKEDLQEILEDCDSYSGGSESDDSDEMIRNDRIDGIYSAVDSAFTGLNEALDEIEGFLE